MRKLWNRPARRASTKTKQTMTGIRFRPCLERLDDRVVPANFNIVQVGGTVTISGAGNLTIDAPITPNSGIFNVLGDVSGTGKLVTGGLQYAGVVNIVVNTTGDSTVDYGSGNLLSLTYNGGAGNDIFNIGSIADDHVFMNLAFKGGAGNDTFRMHNGFNRVVNKLSITGGDGNNTVHLGEEATDRTTLGALSVVNGHGFDTLIAAGQALSVVGGVTINNGLNSNAAFGTGSVTKFATSLNLVIGGTTNIMNGNGDDTVEFGTGAVGAVNTSGVTISNGAGAATTSFLAAISTISGSFNESAKGVNTFTVSGFNFTVGGALGLSGDSNTVNLLSENSIQVTGATKVTGRINGGGVTIGAAGTTSVSLGALNVANGGSLAFAGFNHTINGNLSLTGGSLTISGDQFLINGSLSVAGGGAAIAGSSFTVLANTSIKGGNVTFDSNEETMLRRNVAISGGAVTFNSNQTFLGLTTLTGVGDVTFNGETSVSGSLNMTALGGSFINNARLGLSGGLTINGATNVFLDGPGGTSIAGNLTIGKMAAGVNQFLAVNLQVGGVTNVATGADNDVVSLDASLFNRNVIIAMGDGEDTFDAARNLSDVSTVFGGSVNVDMGTGNDTARIGLPADPFNLCIFTAGVTLNGGAGNDSLDVLTAFNLFANPAAVHETAWEAIV